MLDTRLSAKLRFLGLVLFSSLLLTACSSTKFAYELVDWWTMFKIDRMVDLDKNQRRWVESQVHDIHDWHRRTQLPRYADYLDGLRTRLADGEVTPEELHAETDEVQLMLDQMLERVLEPATVVIASFSKEQVDELLENLAEEREEYVEENIEPGPEERREKQREKFTKYAERFVGGLTDEQEDWIKQWSRELEPYAKLSARQQALWQEHLAKYLALRDDKTLLKKGLRELVLHRSDTWHPDLQAAIDANQALTYHLIARILNNLTPEQQDHLQNELSDYARDFRELARKG